MRCVYDTLRRRRAGGQEGLLETAFKRLSVRSVTRSCQFLHAGYLIARYIRAPECDDLSFPRVCQRLERSCTCKGSYPTRVPACTTRSFSQKISYDLIMTKLIEDLADRTLQPPAEYSPAAYYLRLAKKRSEDVTSSHSPYSMMFLFASRNDKKKISDLTRSEQEGLHTPHVSRLSRQCPHSSTTPACRVSLHVGQRRRSCSCNVATAVAHGSCYFHRWIF